MPYEDPRAQNENLIICSTTRAHVANLWTNLPVGQADVHVEYELRIQMWLSIIPMKHTKFWTDHLCDAKLSGSINGPHGHTEPVFNVFGVGDNCTVQSYVSNSETIA